MAEEAAALSAQELGKLFTRSELQQAFPHHGCARGQDKAALLLAIDALQLREADILQRRLRRSTGSASSRRTARNSPDICSCCFSATAGRA